TVAAFLLVAYAVASGRTTMAIGAGVAAAGGVLVMWQTGRQTIRRTTRYRPSTWSETDTLVCVMSLISALIFFWRRRVYPDAAIFNPYPNVHWPESDVPMLA